jgi:hypothetical protein
MDMFGAGPVSKIQASAPPGKLQLAGVQEYENPGGNPVTLSIVTESIGTGMVPIYK